MDRLTIKGLEIFAFHGVFKSEKELGQKFIVNAQINYDMTQSAKTGDLSTSIHYGVLCEQLTAWCQEKTEDLIESVAYRLVNRIFAHYPMVERVELELKKPWAPVHLPLDYCSVTITRHKKTAYIGLGTNQGDKQEQLKQAILLMKEAGLNVVAESSCIETQPWGFVEQDTFLNQVVVVKTCMEPEELLQQLQMIEQQLKRERTIKWGPRTIDLDILLIDQEVIDTDNLIVPHPYLCERAFVLTSLVELIPHFIHPIARKSMRVLLDELNQKTH